MLASLLQPLLKDALEIVEVRSGGHTRYTIKSLEEQLPFDKVRWCAWRCWLRWVAACSLRLLCC